MRDQLTCYVCMYVLIERLLRQQKYKYTKRNKLTIITSLIREYKVDSSQTNLFDMVTDFDKISAYPSR